MTVPRINIHYGYRLLNKLLVFHSCVFLKYLSVLWIVNCRRYRENIEFRNILFFSILAADHFRYKFTSSTEKQIIRQSAIVSFVTKGGESTLQFDAFNIIRVGGNYICEMTFTETEQIYTSGTMLVRGLYLF